MEKRLRRGLIVSLLSFFLASPRKFPPPSKARTARRSRTTERSESVSEEAEYLLSHIFRLRSAAAFSSCHMKHFTDSRTRAYIVSQYTLR